MKRAISVILCLTFIFSFTFYLPQTVMAVDSGTCGEHLMWEFDPSAGTLTISGVGAMYDYDLYYDSSAEGLFTTTPWSGYSSEIEKVIIENGVTSIGGSAFYGFTGLVSTDIPNSVTRIGWNAFSGCTGLTSIEIPDNVTSIEECAFYGCTGLTSLLIPRYVRNIDYGAFSSCIGIESIVVDPNNVTFHSEGNCLIKKE